MEAERLRIVQEEMDLRDQEALWIERRGQLRVAPGEVSTRPNKAKLLTPRRKMCSKPDRTYWPRAIREKENGNFDLNVHQTRRRPLERAMSYGSSGPA